MRPFTETAYEKGRSRDSLVFKHFHSCFNIALPLPEVMLSLIYLYCIWDIKKGFSSFTGLYISFFFVFVAIFTNDNEDECASNILYIDHNSSIGYAPC